MNLSFWEPVRENWQSVQNNVIDAKVDLELFRKVLFRDITSLGEIGATEDTPIEIDNDDDFWGGL